MSAVSGQYGTVHIGSNELLEVESWKLSRKAAIHQWASNKTGGFKRAVAGVRSGSGSVSGAYDPDDPVDDHIEDGASVTAKLYTTATKFYTVRALIENLDLQVDLNEGDIVGWEASFVTDGPWAKPGGTLPDLNTL